LIETQPPSWQRSRYCESNTCVEAAVIGSDIAVRDSKDPGGPILRFSHDEWTAFIAGVRDGDFRFGTVEA
jgi:hypothetical protein